MKIDVDIHCHTMVSFHAYSTLDEMVRAARGAKLSGIAITNHGPALPDAPIEWHFNCLGFLPPIIRRVRVLSGAEVNIMDSDGTLDLNNDLLSSLEIVIASLHEPCFKPGTRAEHTSAWLNVIENPAVDVLGHMGNANFPFDMPLVLKAAARHRKIVEINNHSFSARPGARELCREIALLCKEYGVYVAATSDAHSMYSVGKVEKSLDLLSEIDFPTELVLSSSLDKLLNHLSSKRK